MIDLALAAPSNVPLLREACDAHGGLIRWQQLTRVDVHLRVRPTLFLGKGLWPHTRTMTVQIDTRRLRAVLTPFPRPGQRGVFEGDDVRIESDDGTMVASLSNARADAQRRFVWNDLHALYFFGYAFWNYTQTPFLFLQPGFDVREGPSLGALRTLNVHYPPHIPSHCTEQTFYFDDKGLLRRLDYTAEIFGRSVRGAHLVEAHRTFGGLVYPTHRYVRAIAPGGWLAPFPYAIEGWVDGMELVEG